MQIPDPLHANLMQKAYEFYLVFGERVPSMTYLGRPINPSIRIKGDTTCGPFSDAITLRGPTELMQDMYDDPKYVHRLLSFVTEATMVRRREWGELVGKKETKENSYCILEHGIEMLSVEIFKEFVLPYHKKLLRTLCKEDCSVSLHHCGNGQHLFKTIHEELGARTFLNLTYPIIDVMKVRRELGERVYLAVLLHPETVLNGPENKIYEMIKNLLTPQVKAKGRLFWRVFIPPGTPLSHTYAVYDAVKRYGKYE